MNLNTKLWIIILITLIIIIAIFGIIKSKIMVEQEIVGSLKGFEFSDDTICGKCAEEGGTGLCSYTCCFFELICW